MSSDILDLKLLFDSLYNYFGEQHWWPADSKLEMIVGAILTQNTSWKNVEIVIKNLKNKNLLNLNDLFTINTEELAELIRSSGFYKQKALRVKNFVEIIRKDFNGDLELFLSQKDVYERLISINGIGRETADSIILYAANRPVFVIDIYSLRILKRLGYAIKEDKKEYSKAQNLFDKDLNKDVSLFKEYHALLVLLGKQYCKKIPLCKNCPVTKRCKKVI
jgi:endonuclease-3 related protein